MSATNIIVVFSDQHRGDAIHAMGDPYVRTPNMDAMAENGVMFENAYCNSPLCVPSRSSLLSGQMPHRTKIFNNTQSLPSDKATFVHSLAGAGYETVLAGRMHFNGPDQRHGFEKRFVGDISSVSLGITMSKERYGYFDGCSTPHRVSIERSGKGECAVMAFDRDVTASACDFLRKRRDDRPLFMTVGLYGPHPPYVGPQDLYDYYYETLPDPKPITAEEFELAHPFEQRFMKNRNIGHESVEELRRVRAAYYAMIEYEDRILGEILDVVRETMDMSNTLILYISDHGDSIGEHGLFWKSNMREGALKVPIIAMWEGHSAVGAKIQTPISLIDIAPTLIDFANAQKMPIQDGNSFKNTILTGEEPSASPIISEIIDIKGDSPAAMIRDGKYKYIRYHGYSDHLLYDLEADPHELNNLAGNPEFAEIEAKLDAILCEVWDDEAMYQNHLLMEEDLKIRRTWAKEQQPLLFYDEWRQIGWERNANYLITDEGIVF